MPREFYVAEDGTIHARPMTVTTNTGNHTNTYAPAPVAVHAQGRTEYRQAPGVGVGRKVGFWIFSVCGSLLISLAIIQGFGTELFGDDALIATVGPYIITIGALAGCILYGIFCAKSVSYNLWAYILSALSSVGGILVTVIAAVILSFVLMILFYAIVIVIVIAVLCCAAGGS